MFLVFSRKTKGRAGGCKKTKIIRMLQVPDQPEKEIWGGEEDKEGSRSRGQSSSNSVCRRKLLNT